MTEKTPNTTKPKLKSKEASGPTFWFLCTMTVVWFLALVFLISQTEKCGDELGFWAGWLSCRDSNELGDLLAGAFAPVAFIWLAGAVLIQSKELQAVRNEHEATRLIYDQEIKLIKAQGEESRRTAEFIEIQANAMKESAEQQQFAAIKKSHEDDVNEFANWIPTLSPHFILTIFHSPKQGIFGEPWKPEMKARVTQLLDYVIRTSTVKSPDFGSCIYFHPRNRIDLKFYMQRIVSSAYTLKNFSPTELARYEKAISSLLEIDKKLDRD